MFKDQPKGLFALALANTGERFGYYTMIAVFSLFLSANFGLTEGQAGTITVSSWLLSICSLSLEVLLPIGSGTEKWSPLALW